MGQVVLVLIATPLVAAVAGWCLRIPGRVWGPAAGLLSTVLAALVAATVIVDGPVEWIAVGGGGHPVLGWRFDQLGAVLLPVVCGIGAMVQVFARRYLYGDRRSDRFFVATAVLSAATIAMLSAVTLIGFAVAWTIAGIALCAMLGLYPQLPAARDGVRRTAWSFLIGDAALWVAVVLVVARSGEWDLRGDAPAALTGPAGTVVALLVVLAAAARSTQLPFVRWLPATLAAPTPVSALLHAGVVNAGAVLLVRTGTLVTSSALAMAVLFALGTGTALYGTVLMLTKPDIKGALAHSTMGQMGFMIMTCGLGLFTTAIFHLVAHGMYKATLFLGSGSAVAQHVRHQHALPRPALTRARRAAVAAFAVITPAFMLAAAIRWPFLTPPGHNGTVLLVFGWAAAAWACWAWLRYRPTVVRAGAAVAALLLAAPAYLAAIAVVSRFLQPAMPTVAGATAAWWVVAPAACMAAATVVRLNPDLPGVNRIHRRLYVWALTQAHPPTRTTAPPAAIPAARHPLGVPARVGASA